MEGLDERIYFELFECQLAGVLLGYCQVRGLGLVAS